MCKLLTYSILVKTSRIHTKLKTLLLCLTVLSFSSCDSEDLDSINTAGNNEFNSSAQETSQLLSEVLLDNGLTEFVEALNYVNEEIYTQLPELFASGSEQNTIFAPSNEAFFKLYNCLGLVTQDISEIGDPGFVRDILLYHVAKGRRPSGSIIPNNSEFEVETRYGKSLFINSDGSVQGVGSKAYLDIKLADKTAANGIVHIIDEVLLTEELLCLENSN